MKAVFLLFAVSSSALAADADLLRCRSLTDANARVACYDAIPVGPAPAASAAVAVPATAVQAAEARFGQTTIARTTESEPKQVATRLLGKMSGWGPGTQFRFENGQVWRVADDTSASIEEKDNPKVVLKRNFFGTVFMEIEGTNHAPRVRRVQ